MGARTWNINDDGSTFISITTLRTLAFSNIRS